MCLPLEALSQQFVKPVSVYAQMVQRGESVSLVNHSLLLAITVYGRRFLPKLNQNLLKTKKRVHTSPEGS